MTDYLIVALDENEGKFLNYTYFHGKLEKDNKYDLVNVVGSTLSNLISNTENGIIDTVALVKDEFKPVKMFIWTTKRLITKCLICYTDDLESIADAEYKQDNLIEDI